MFFPDDPLAPDRGDPGLRLLPVLLPVDSFVESGELLRCGAAMLLRRPAMVQGVECCQVVPREDVASLKFGLCGETVELL